MSTARERYEAAITERERLQREVAALAIKVVFGQPDRTKAKRRRLMLEASIQRDLAEEAMTEWIAERKARDASQPTGQGGE